jgi:hypothetical protein
MCNADALGACLGISPDRHCKCNSCYDSRLLELIQVIYMAFAQFVLTLVHLSCAPASCVCCKGGSTLHRLPPRFRIRRAFSQKAIRVRTFLHGTRPTAAGSDEAGRGDSQNSPQDQRAGGIPWAKTIQLRTAPAFVNPGWRLVYLARLRQLQVLPSAMGANSDPEALQPLLDDSGCADGA